MIKLPTDIIHLIFVYLEWVDISSVLSVKQICNRIKENDSVYDKMIARYVRSTLNGTSLIFMYDVRGMTNYRYFVLHSDTNRILITSPEDVDEIKLYAFVVDINKCITFELNISNKYYYFKSANEETFEKGRPLVTLSGFNYTNRVKCAKYGPFKINFTKDDECINFHLRRSIIDRDYLYLLKYFELSSFIACNWKSIRLNLSVA